MTYVSDLRAYDTYWLTAPLGGLVCNYYTPYPSGNGETYIDEHILVEIEALLTRYWPNIQLPGQSLSGLPESEYQPSRNLLCQ
jgi:hypothetical protein